MSTDNIAEEWVDGENSCQNLYRALAGFVKTGHFDYIMGGFILLNTIFIGIDTDWQAQDLARGGDGVQAFMAKVTETIFAAVFLVEWLLRLVVWNRWFFCSAWNNFDTLVVVCSTFEEILKYADDEDTIAGTISGLRILRVLKLLRTLRIIRVVRAFRELRLVLTSILLCLRQLFWTLVLLFVLMYLVALIILSELVQNSSAYASNGFGDLRRLHFSSLGRAILTVYQCTTFGIPWDTASRALEDLIPWVWIVWSFYMGFIVFAFSNTVNGIFVDLTIRESNDDLRNVMLEEKSSQEVMIAELRTALFRNAEADGDITIKSLAAVLKDPKVTMYFKKFDIDKRDIFAFFDIISMQGEIVTLDNLDKFLYSIMRVKGSARNVDLMAMCYALTV